MTFKQDKQIGMNEVYISFLVYQKISHSSQRFSLSIPNQSLNILFQSSLASLNSLPHSLVYQTQHSQTVAVVATEDPAAATVVDPTIATVDPIGLGYFWVGLSDGF